MSTAINSSHVSKILFVVYNFIYVFYMEDYLPRTLYLAFVLVYCIAATLMILKNNDWIISFKKFFFIKEFGAIMMIALSFAIITLIMQINNNHFQLSLFMDLLYLVLPMIIVFFIANIDAKDYKFYIYTILVKSAMQFFLLNSGNISIANILAVNFNDSHSSAFESPLAHTFYLLLIIFLYTKNKKLAIVCTVLSVLSFKRLSFIMSAVTWVVFWFLPKKEVNKYFIIFVKIVLILVPYGLLWFYSPAGYDFFMINFEFDIIEFTTKRYNLVVEVMEEFDGVYNGYGTVRDYYANKNAYYAGLVSMHCDYLSLYLECTIVGIVIYATNIVNIIKKDWRVFYMGAYLLLQLMISIFIEGVQEWMLLYFFAFIVSYDKHKKSEEEKALSSESVTLTT